MKGLLLKDWYMMKKYCRHHLLVGIGFAALSLLSSGNMFFAFYSCLLYGMIPINLIGYDERSHWIEYSGTLPYTKTQIVSAKYLIGLFVQIAMLIVVCAVQGVKMSINGNFALNSFIILMLLILTATIFTSSIALPLIFKLGVEKGRMAQYMMLGVACAGSIAAHGIANTTSQSEIQLNGILPILCLIVIGLYALSWYLSVLFYKKREI